MQKLYSLCLIFLLSISNVAHANPWNGNVVFQGFWWGCWNENYPQDWYTFLAKLSPRLRELGFDGIWIPSPTKGWEGLDDMGYGVYDHYDLGDKNQKNTVATRFGTKDSLLRFIAVAHANGLEVYPDIVLNHVIGGETDASAPEGDKYKKFRYTGYAGENTGRWAKDHWNFHPNPDHNCQQGDECGTLLGADICYLDNQHGGGGNGQYMLGQAREWLVWFKKQTDADGFRLDAVKHFPAYVVEDVLYNAMGGSNQFFCAGEHVSGAKQLDDWANATQNRCGTFDFSLRNALAAMIQQGGAFDMGSLPSAQQQNRLKTSPFLNNHDTWKGAFWDSATIASTQHDDRDGDWRQNNKEILPTVDPDNPRTDVAYAAIFAVDGSPTVYFEDLFINYGNDRFSVKPEDIKVRDYVANIIWTHQKLDFKDGAYKVRYQNSKDLLVIERSGKALIALNDSSTQTLQAWVATDFGKNVALHNYSASDSGDISTNQDGWVQISVPPMSYAIWAPVGVSGGFSPASRRTTQEFQMADDLGDSDPNSLAYGGKLCAGDFRTAGAIWAAKETDINVNLYADNSINAEIAVFLPDDKGNKQRTQGTRKKQGSASNNQALTLSFKSTREGYYQIAARLKGNSTKCTRAYIKANYQAPAVSDKF